MTPLHPFPYPPKPWSTPTYYYSRDRLNSLYQLFRQSCPESLVELRFAMKCNDSEDILKTFLGAGAGVDVVSGGELRQAVSVGFSPSRIVFSGVGKTDEELSEAVRLGIELIQIESTSEWNRLHTICRSLHKKCSVGFRVNPDIDAKTHPYISTGLSQHKFGLDFASVIQLATSQERDSPLRIEGLSFHIGSQLFDLQSIHQAAEKTLQLAEDLLRLGAPLKTLNMGGGLGVSYSFPEIAPDFEHYGKVIQLISQKWQQMTNGGGRLLCELGRCLVAQAGVLLTRVIAIKTNSTKNFCIVDAGMNDLLRPALYQASHPIERWPREEPPPSSQSQEKSLVLYDVVGPVCETSDVLGAARLLPALREGDYLAIAMTGAYGHVMASTYNGRPLPKIHSF